jgi:HPt (histidine-containing phosphotransfer) domain-containing protein
MSNDDSSLTLIDLAIARQNIPGDISAVGEMAGIMDSECNRLMAELQSSQAENDPPKFRRAAHTLKSAAAVFGAQSVVEPARELEAIGKSGNLADVGDRVTELEALVDRLRSELKIVIQDTSA